MNKNHITEEVITPYRDYKSYRVEIDFTDPKNTRSRLLWRKENGSVVEDEWILTPQLRSVEDLKISFYDLAVRDIKEEYDKTYSRPLVLEEI